MIYTLEFYQRGRLFKSSKRSAKSHRQTLLGETWINHSHVVVTGKTVKRFNKDGKEIKGQPKLWKAYSDSNPSVLVAIGSVTEFYRFNTVEERDRAYEEVVCIDSTSAESAEADKEQNGITVSTEGTNDSESGLTLTKISNGSAKSATWRDTLTLLSIDKNSGVDSVDDTDSDTWSSGSMPFPSNRNLNSSSKMKAIVLRIPDRDYEVGTNHHMQSLEGRTIEVKKYGDYYKGGGWTWKEEWLEFLAERVTIKYVKAIRVGQFLDGVTFVYDMVRYIGKPITVQKFVNHSGYKCYEQNGAEWQYAEGWLSDFPTDENTKKYVILPYEKGGQMYTDAMVKLAGNIVTIEHNSGPNSVYVNENPFIWNMKSLMEVK